MNPERIQQIVLVLQFAVTLALAWIVLSFVARVVRGRPISPGAPKDAVFLDRHAGGASLKSNFTERGGAISALLVAVTPDELVVAPRFPFSLAFLPELLDLEHRVAKAECHAAYVRDTWSRPRVLVEFHDRRRRFCRLMLKVEHPDALALALNGTTEKLEAPAEGVAEG